MIFRNLFRRKGRTILTLVGISIGVAAIVALGAMAEGMRAGYTAIAQGNQADLVITQKGAMDITLGGVEETVADQLRAWPEVADVDGMLMGNVQAEDASYFFIFGYDPEGFAIAHFRIVEGQSLAETQRVRGRPLILGRGAAQSLHKSVGDTLRVTGGVFRIVGIYEKGYTNTTMDDIAAELGVSKGTLYWYFESKDELLMAALTSMFEGLGEEAMAALDTCETAADKLRAAASAMVRVCREAPWFFSLLIEFWAQSPRRDEASQTWAEMLAQYAEVIAGTVEEGIQRGEFRPVDARQLAWALMAVYDSLAVYISIRPDLDLERISETFIETILQGLQH